jgi:hypothetical protein
MRTPLWSFRDQFKGGNVPNRGTITWTSAGLKPLALPLDWKFSEFTAEIEGFNSLRTNFGEAGDGPQGEGRKEKEGGSP